MPEAAIQFTCGHCGRKLAWKQQLIGKKGKCKCGQVITVPPRPDGEPEPDGEYDLTALVADAEKAAAEMPPTIVEAPPPPPKRKSATKSATRPAPPPIKDDSDPAGDKMRDVTVPLAMAGVGVLLHVSYYMIHYSLGMAAIGPIALGLCIITGLETVLLVGVALALSEPLSIGFGDFRMAIAKFAAMAAFCDGVSVWISGFMSKIAGSLGSGVFGYLAIGLPVAILIYWISMTYLFSLDHSESWSMVAIIAILYRVARLLLAIMVLSAVLGWGGVSRSDMDIPSIGGGGAASPMVDEVEHAKAMGLLLEARQYIAKTGRVAESGHVNDWYAAGAKSVWYQVTRDINGHGNAYQVVVELPSDPAQRAKCFDIARQWCRDYKVADPGEIRDAGEPYEFVPLP